MPVVQQFCEVLAGLDWNAVPPAVRTQTGLVLADTLGALVAGTREAQVAAIAARYDGAGSVAIPGTRWRAIPENAAFINGFAGTALELDEGNYRAGGHPAIHALAAALAEWAVNPVPVERCAAALLVGYEAGARVGMATSLRSAAHPHGTWGVIGAAAAVAVLRGYDATRFANALGLAASLSLATSVTASLNSSAIRNIYAGVAAQNGLLACNLAEAGMTAEPAAIARVFGQVVGSHFDENALMRGLGEDWLIMDTFLKTASSCRETQGALAALEVMLAEAPVEIGAVDHIRVATFASAAALAQTSPTSPIGGRFSIPFVLAVRLLRGHAWIDAFTEQTLADPAIQALARRVSVGEDPSFTAQLPHKRICRVALRQEDGTTRYSEIFATPGDPGTPLPEGALAAKFARMTGKEGEAWERLNHFAFRDYAELAAMVG